METPAVYRERDGDPWQDCVIIGFLPPGVYVLREVDKALPGVWRAYRYQVRLPGAVIEQPEIVPRTHDLGAKRWGKYRTIREVCGRDEALRQVIEP